MRMWNINPKLLCNKHLLGEHLEMHMFVGAINKGKSIKGYIDKGLVETNFISYRHQDLAIELERRGFNHKSPLPPFKIEAPYGRIDVTGNINELNRRCKDCRHRHHNQDVYLHGKESQRQPQSEVESRS